MRKKWTPERVLEEIMVIYRKGKPLSSGYAIKHYPSLYHGARGRFGSWPKAIEACGIDYDSVRKVRTWTKDKIIREIKRLQKTGLGLASSDLDRYYPKLKSAAKKHFGGLSQAYAAAGIAYKKIRKTKEWSEYLVLKTLRKLIRKRMIKRLKQFRDEYPSLYKACRHYFKTWRRAFVAAGLDPHCIEEVTIWSKEQIIKTLKQKINSGEITHLSDLRKKFHRLYYACIDHFGGWRQALKAAGLPEDRIKKSVLSWSKKVIINELKTLFRKGKIKSLADLRIKFPRLLWACREYYGTWQKALQAASIDYRQIKLRERK